MPSRHLGTFVSGRLIALVLLFAFQILVARVLPPAQYAAFALTLGLSALVQTAGSFGIARVSARYLSQAGLTVSKATARNLALGLISLRIVGSVATIAIPATALWLLSPGFRSSGAQLVVASALYIAFTALQFDLDGMAQALMLQPQSRLVAVGEPLLRLIGLGAIVLESRGHNAAVILSVSVATSFLACLTLGRAIAKALAGTDDDRDRFNNLVWRDVGRLAVGGYASTLAWFATSPATVRVWGARILTLTTFAGFSFAQSLVVSLQRYTPGFMLFPFIEPAVMRGENNGSSSSRLEAILSLTIKIDLTVIGAAIVGCSTAGPQLIGALSGGKYVAEAGALPWLLLVIVGNSAYRASEIAAVRVGLGHKLIRMLPVSIVWLLLMGLARSSFGFWPLLLAPLGDAASRLAILNFMLHTEGHVKVIDLQRCGYILLSTVAFAIGGHAVCKLLAFNGLTTIALGAASSLAYLGCIAFVRPINAREASLLHPVHPLAARMLPFISSAS